MPPDTIIGLNLVDTDALVQELCNRHESIIIIREDRKDDDTFYVSAKTPLGRHGKPEVGFDLIYAMELICNAQFDLVAQHFGLPKAEEDNSGDSQDAREGP